MSIAHYIKEIGRGKDGARSLSREQATDLFGQVLDGTITDLELGAFCLAMRIKGETPQEMAGFLDATHQRLLVFPASTRPVVVLPSYNGARRLPNLTPLLALLLAKEGLPVLVHGTATEASRVSSASILAELGVPALENLQPLVAGKVAFAPTGLLCPGLQALLDVRRVVGLRNPGHSLVKLMNPVQGASLIVSSYTHPEYATSMAAVFELMQADALLLRGTEGEAVADPRRVPHMESFLGGQRRLLTETQGGSLQGLPDLPKDISAISTADYTKRVLDGECTLPGPIATQLEHILRLVSQLA